MTLLEFNQHTMNTDLYGEIYGSGVYPLPSGYIVPRPQEVLDVTAADGATIIVRRHGNPNGPRLLLSHGCGLASDLYYPYWSLLTDRFEVCLFDMRSHGWNPAVSTGSFNIPTMVGDSRAVIEAISSSWGEKPCYGVFHSISTIVGLAHQLEKPDFAALVLFDPALQWPLRGNKTIDDVCRRQARRARRRQRHFESYCEMAKMFANAPAYSLIPPDVLMLLAETTLRYAEGGGYELRCSPEQEAQLYEWYFGFSMQIIDKLDSYDIPLKAIGADPTFQNSFIPSFNLSKLSKFEYDFLPDKTHFLQLEAPEECATLTVEFLEQHGLA
ncbi:MAG: alpha/beta hydrolase [bacterium]|nr:alpha/beta hydrolase [bacterium]